jgi:hypothetical protein
MIINSYIFGSSVSDADAQAFITAAAITDNTQKNAINNLVINLKAAGIWSKMKAVYPMVGGTASSHKWNLKDPRDLDAAFRLTFTGGWIHASTGAKPNGTNGYADTKCNMSTNYSVDTSVHISYYSRTDGSFVSQDMSVYNGTTVSAIIIRRADFPNHSFFGANTDNYISLSFDSNGAAFYISNRTALNIVNGWRNSTKVATGTNTALSRPNLNMFLANMNFNGVPNSGLYGKRECAFASIGDGLLDSEALVFNQIVEGYQYALGRNINPVNQNYYNTLYNNETNAFLYSSQITDNTQKTAVNTLVSDLKTAGIWTKMRAVYPFVGGTASTHKWNLINPQDTDAAFRLTFTGGWTHSSTGATPNGVNAFANTFFNPSLNSLQNSHHFSLYLRNNEADKIPFGCTIITTGLNGTTIIPRLSNLTYYGINQSGYSPTHSETDSKAFYLVTRTSSSVSKIFRNTTLKGTSSVASGAGVNANYYIAHWNSPGVTTYYSAAQNAFTTIGDGLTDAEAANFYTAVQNFNTALARNI